MKKIFSLLLLAILLFGCNNISEHKVKEAKDFHQKLGLYFTPVTDGLNSIFKFQKPIVKKSIAGTASKAEIDQLETALNNLFLEIDKSAESINNMVEFDENIKLKEVLLNYLTGLKSILQNEYKEFIALLRNEMTDENREKSADIILEIFNKINELEEPKEQLQKEFVKKYYNK